MATEGSESHVRIVMVFVQTGVEEGAITDTLLVVRNAWFKEPIKVI